MLRRAVVLAALALGGCNRLAANTDFERMIDQAKFEAYEDDYTADERGVMRHPPAGTVARESVIPPELTAELAGEYRRRMPVTVDRPLLERGRDRFERYCAPCHGVTGHGNNPVTENMTLRPPPSLHRADIEDQPPGRIFSTITHGYGMMPSYANELEPRDRWAVVAYLHALWLSQEAELATLPSYLRSLWHSQQRALAALPTRRPHQASKELR